MAEIKDWNVSAASNNGTPPDGAPEGMAPSAVNDVIRENMAVLARWLGDTNGALTATGTADAQLLAPNRTVTAYARGDVYAFRPVADNTGPCTLNVSSLGAKSIKTPIGTDPLAGALDTSSVATVIYDGTNFVLVSGAGSASFTELSVTGDVTFDSGLLFVDASADQVAVGTLSPNADDKLSLETTSGIESLTVSGTDNSANGYVRVDTPANRRAAFVFETAGTAAFTVERGDSDDGDATKLYVHTGAPDGGASSDLVMDSSGNVGIGTTSPVEKLDVVGNAKASGAHYSSSGTTSTPNATWTTVRTFSSGDIEQGIFSVEIQSGDTGAVVAYNKLYDGGSDHTSETVLDSRGSIQVRWSGLSFQVYQNVGFTLNARWKFMKTSEF